jgi:hypothetical protein
MTMVQQRENQKTKIINNNTSDDSYDNNNDNSTAIFLLDLLRYILTQSSQKLDYQIPHQPHIQRTKQCRSCVLQGAMI